MGWQHSVANRARAAGCAGRGLEIGPGRMPIPGLDQELLDICDDFSSYGKYQVDHLGKADDTDFADNSYDFVIGSNVLEHFPNPIKALLEWHRILRPGGIVYCVQPDKRLYCVDRVKPETAPGIAWKRYQEDMDNYPPVLECFSYHENPALKRYIDGHKYYWTIDSCLEDVRTYLADRFEVAAEYSHSEAFIKAFKTLLAEHGRDYLNPNAAQIEWEQCVHRHLAKLCPDEPENLYYHFEFALRVVKEPVAR